MKRPPLGFISALVCFLIVGGVYFWWYESVSSLSATAANLSDQIDTKSRTESRITEAQTQIADLAPEEAAVEGYFVAQANIVPFIEQLQALGSAAGASVTVLSVSAGTGAAGSPITITLSIAGTFDHVVRAAGAIEYAPYDLTVSELGVSQQQGAWQADMTLVVGSTISAAPLPTPVAATSTSITATSTSQSTTTPTL